MGYLMYTPGMLLFMNGDFNLLLLAFFLYSLINTLQLTSYQALLGDMIPKNFRGTDNGCIHFFMYFVQGVLQLAIGFLPAFVVPPLIFLLLVAMVLPLATFITFKVSEPKARKYENGNR
jgi:hypothetical protein